jgi:type VI secretion system protein ImpA
MPPLDAGSLLEVVSEDSPAGPNLEFDPDFGALERAAQGKPEQQYGGTIIPAEEPDWKEVESQAGALLERSRDLRVLGQLAVSRLHLSGLPAYAEVLSMTRQLLETRWDEIHPQLDPEEDNDPTLRANALLRLAHPGDVLRCLRTLPLARSARIGQYSWREVGIATGTIESSEEPKPTEALIRGAFEDTDPARLDALRNAATEAAASATAIAAVFDTRAGYGTGPDYEELVKLLKDIARTIDRYFVAVPADEKAEASADDGAMDAAAEGGAADGGAADGGAADGGGAPVARRARGGVSIASLTEVTNRADALRLLDLVCRYYQRYEPASPLSMLIERAAGLAEKNFLDIVRELAPDGLAQVQNVIGARNE